MNVDSGSMVVSLPFGKLTNFLVNYRSRLMADLALDGCLQGDIFEFAILKIQNRGVRAFLARRRCDG